MRTSLAISSILALAMAAPTTDHNLEPRAQLDCSTIKNFYIQAIGGWAPGYYFQIDSEFQQILVDAANTTVASQFALTSKGALVLPISENGQAAGTPLTIFRRSYQDGDVYTLPGGTKNQNPISCTIGALAKGVCPLSCSAKQGGKSSQTYFNVTYTESGGKAVFASIGIPNDPDQLVKPTTWSAVPVAA